MTDKTDTTQPTGGSAEPFSIGPITFGGEMPENLYPIGALAFTF